MNNENYENVSAAEHKIKPEKPNSKRKIKIGIFALLVVFLLFFVNPFYVLNEGEAAIITKFGEVVNTETAAGLHFKIPFIHTVHKYTAKLLRLDGDPQKILTKEKQFIEVDTTSRWRISDIKKF